MYTVPTSILSYLIRKMGYWHQRLLLLSWLSAATSVVAIAVEEKSPFDVGVVLKKDSWIGDVGWSCIKISLHDFYKKNKHYKTKLRLHFRDSGDTAFGAASAAMDLIDKKQVHAIIGPQYSRQAKFLMAIGSKTHIPVISFSATSPSLSYGQAEYFIRTTVNNYIQVEAIASLVQHFKRKEVIHIFEDDLYVIDTVTLLMDSLQEKEVNVSYQINISTSATRKQIHRELSRLRDKRTKVFVVHIFSRSMGTKLFSCAQELGMMGKGYVWIVTHDVIDSSKSAHMHGVLGLEPCFPKPGRLTRFKLRWKKEFRKEHPEVTVEEVNATEPSCFGLWAYDTVQALAEAVESSFKQNSSWNYGYKVNSSSDHLEEYSPIGPKLLNSLVDTNFIGLSGKFKLTYKQLSIPGVGIINVVGNDKRRVGNFSGDKIDIDENRISWPGNATTKPRGWEWPINGHKLTVGKPGEKKGFKQLRKFCIDVFEKVMERLPYEVPYEYVVFEDSNGNMNDTYDKLVEQVYLKNLDAVVGDVTILASRSEYVDFTLPFMGSQAVMVVPVKDYNNKNAWAFLHPMKTDLWCAIGLFIIFTGVVVWVLERDVNHQFSGGMGITFYFSFSALVFAHGEKIVSNRSRIVLAVWLFAVLILTSSYTANLTSMLTVKQIKPTVTNIDQLIKDGRDVGYLRDSFIFEFLKGLKFQESNLRAFDSPEAYQKALSDGTIAAFVDETPYVKFFLSEYCGKYTIVGPTHQKHGFGFVFPKGSPLVPDVSKATLNFTETEEFREMEKKIYNKNDCLDETEDESSWVSLTLESFKALFVITVVTSGIAVILHLLLVFRETKKSSGSGEGNFSLWEITRLMFLNKKDGGDVTDYTQSPTSNNRIKSPTLNNRELDDRMSKMTESYLEEIECLKQAKTDADAAHSLATKVFEEKLAELNKSLTELKVKYEGREMALNTPRK